MSPGIMLLVLTAQEGLVQAVGYPAGVLAAIGLLFGLGLAFAAKKLAVSKDPKVEEIEKLLPGANCGGCGVPGCSAFAEGVVKGELPPNGCVAASVATNAEIARIIGAEISDTVRKIALVHCNGGYSATNAFEYYGPKNCVSEAMIMGGRKTCRFGCLEYGDCVEVCLFDAIRIGEQGVPVIDRKACTGCGKCVEICPKDIIELWPYNREVVVACSSHDKGAQARKACSVACIGCHKCEKACPVDAITIDEFLARIDPGICIGCGVCATMCPTGAIFDNIPARPKAFIESTCVGCTLCVEACPVGAITGSLKEKHSVDLEKCIGCGLCVQKCPKNSIRMMGALCYQKEEGIV